jgi:hypothetical protein
MKQTGVDEKTEHLRKSMQSTNCSLISYSKFDHLFHYIFPKTENKNFDNILKRLNALVSENAKTAIATEVKMLQSVPDVLPAYVTVRY